MTKIAAISWMMTQVRVISDCGKWKLLLKGYSNSTFFHFEIRPVSHRYVLKEASNFINWYFLFFELEILESSNWFFAGEISGSQQNMTNTFFQEFSLLFKAWYIINLWFWFLRIRKLPFFVIKTLLSLFTCYISLAKDLFALDNRTKWACVCKL